MGATGTGNSREKIQANTAFAVGDCENQHVDKTHIMVKSTQQ